MIDGSASRRKNERLKWFGDHLVEIVSRRDAEADVRMVMVADLFGNEGGHVIDEKRVFGGIGLRCREGADRAGFQRVRAHGGNHFLLQLQKLSARPNLNVCNANVPS